MNQVLFQKPENFSKLSLAFTGMLLIANLVAAQTPPLIFPAPQQFEISNNYFDLKKNVSIVIPQKASDNDIFLAQSLSREFTDKYGLTIKIETVTRPPADKQYILMGSIDNPLVKEYCNQKKLEVSAKVPGPEGYILQVNENNIIVAGSDNPGAFYGLQSLRQLINKNLQVQGLTVRDWPNMPFRGIKLYLPGRDNIPFFKRFVNEFMALYKFNKVIIETNAAMRLDRHPELNEGWREFARELDFSRRSRALGPGNYSQNSTHHDTGEGDILEKEEVKDLVQFCNQRFIETIPEIPTLSHSFYLLTRHRELADVQNSEWPGTYCPSNPETYKLLFDVFDEYIEIMQPKMIHIGRDEWWGAPIDYCSRCQGKDYFELFSDDLNKIYAYLSKKGIEVAMWGDHLLENVRGKGYVNRKSPTGYQYRTPGGLPLSMVKQKIPKDILVFNWFFDDESNDKFLSELGFKQVYGNFLPDIKNWGERRKLSGVLGGAPSSWAATTEFNFGKDLLDFFIGCSGLLWSGNQELNPHEHFQTGRQLMPGIRMSLDGIKLPSESDPVIPFKIEQCFNDFPANLGIEIDRKALKTGKAMSDRLTFDLPQTSRFAVIAQTSGANKARSVQPAGIPINEDVNSLIFLHASAKPARNEKAYRMIFNFDDTADLLGWYEIEYEDGFIETVPIRYGYNILEWNVGRAENYQEWYDLGQGSSQGRYCYRADAVDCSVDRQNKPVDFFAFEWINNRFGKKISEVRLRGAENFVSSMNKPIEDNAIMLIALSIVKAREIPVIEPLK